MFCDFNLQAFDWTGHVEKTYLHLVGKLTSDRTMPETARQAADAEGKGGAYLLRELLLGQRDGILDFLAARVAGQVTRQQGHPRLARACHFRRLLTRRSQGAEDMDFKRLRKAFAVGRKHRQGEAERESASHLRHRQVGDARGLFNARRLRGTLRAAGEKQAGADDDSGPLFQGAGSHGMGCVSVFRFVSG